MRGGGGSSLVESGALTAWVVLNTCFSGTVFVTLFLTTVTPTRMFYRFGGHFWVGHIGIHPPPFPLSQISRKGLLWTQTKYYFSFFLAGWKQGLLHKQLRYIGPTAGRGRRTPRAANGSRHWPEVVLPTGSSSGQWRLKTSSCRWLADVDAVYISSFRF